MEEIFNPIYRAKPYIIRLKVDNIICITKYSIKCCIKRKGLGNEDISYRKPKRRSGKINKLLGNWKLPQ